MNDQQILNAALRSHLGLFIQRAFKTVSPGAAYKHNWHVDAIAHALTQCANGKIKRLVITMPPRHLKTISASIAFVAWLLGRDPSARVICASYAQDLANKFSKDTRLVMESAWYRTCFPNTVLSDTTNNQVEFTTTQHGSRLAVSVGGALTGRGGAFLIIDDPHKSDEAYSDLKRQQVVEWFWSTAVSRLDDPKSGCIIVIQQRFHEGDLAGTLLETGEWTHLNLPAIAEDRQDIPIAPGEIHVRLPGEVLHPEHLPLPDLEKLRTGMGSIRFSGQYQQRPTACGGEIVKWQWFKSYDDPPRAKLGDRIIQSWDHAYTTSEGSSFSACSTWLCQDARLYLLDMYRGRMEFPDLLRVIPAHAGKWKAGHVVLEWAGAGITLCQELRRLDPAKYCWSEPKNDKVTRLTMVSHLIESGLVYLPTQSPWLEAFRREFQAFPRGNYDDQVDSVSQFLRVWPTLRKMPVGIYAGDDADQEVAASRITTIPKLPGHLSFDDLCVSRAY